jgi:hypothetical protein
MGVQLGGRMKVALGEGRRLEQLPVAVAVAVGRLDLPRGVEDEPGLRRLGELEAIGRPSRDHDVVVLAEADLAEDRLQRARALADEDHLVALAVAEEALLLLLGSAEGDLEIAVPHQAAPTGDRIAGGLDGPRDQVAMHVGVGHPFDVLDRLEIAGLRDPAGRFEVVEDRLVAGEPLEAHHLLDQQPAVVAELDVALAGDVAEPVVPHRLPLLSCSRSIASNRALKLPSPKPRAPWRSITSRKRVGRSPRVSVKICSR